MFTTPAGMTLVPLSLLLAACSRTSVSSEGVRAAPLTVVSSTQATPGQALTVSAAKMWDGCNDQGEGINHKLPPLKNQPITMTREGKVVELGRVSADPETGLAQAEVTIPATTAPGQIELRIAGAEPVEVTLVRK